MTQNKSTGIHALNMDIWRMIMLLVAQSHDGARSLARARAACKCFKEAAKDKLVLQSLDFHKRSVSLYPISFWDINGLFNKCMQAGNVSALDLILKHITTRLIILRQKRILADRVIEHYKQADSAARTLNTSATKRNAESLKKDVRERITDIMKDRKEIGELRMMYRLSNFL